MQYGILMFSNSSDSFTHDHVAGCRTLLGNTSCLHVSILWVVYSLSWERIWEKQITYSFIQSFIVCACMLSHFSHIWLCNAMDCILPGSSVHGILQARILEWVAMPSSRGFSHPRNWTRVSCFGRQVFFTTNATCEAWFSFIQLIIYCLPNHLGRLGFGGTERKDLV